MINLAMDTKCLALAIGFWIATIWTEKQLRRQELNPWDYAALMVGGCVASVGATALTLGFCIISLSLMVSP